MTSTAHPREHSPPNPNLPINCGSSSVRIAYRTSWMSLSMEATSSSWCLRGMHCYGWGCELVDDDLVVVEELDGCGEGYSLPEHLLQVSELLFALDHKKGLFSSIKNGTVHCVFLQLRPRSYGALGSAADIPTLAVHAPVYMKIQQVITECRSPNSPLCSSPRQRDSRIRACMSVTPNREATTQYWTPSHTDCNACGTQSRVI
jgi:hypothetical protein